MPINTNNLVFILLLAAIAATTTCGVLAWSPSERPSIFDGPTPPYGLKFGLNPMNTKCCYRSSNNLYCATDGTRDDRVRITKFTISPDLDIVDEFTLDENDMYKVGKCSFLVYSSGTAYIGFVKDYTQQQPKDTILFSVDPVAFAEVGSAKTFGNCALSTPSSGAVATDSGIILATGSAGLFRLELNAGGGGNNNGVCKQVMLEQPTGGPPNQQQGGSSAGTVFGGYRASSGGPTAANTSYWVTASGLFKYDANEDKVVKNITLVNGTANQALFAEAPPNNLFVYAPYTPTQTPGGPPGPPPSTSYLVHHVNLGAYTLVQTYNLPMSQELVGFMRVDLIGDQLVAGIRSPYLGIINYTISTLMSSKWDVTGMSTSDSGAVLPQGNKYFQQGNNPTTFCWYDGPSKNVVIFAIPKLAPMPGPGGQQQLLLPTLGIVFSTQWMERTSHYVMRPGAQDVATSVVGASSYFVVLASTPGLIVQVSADDLWEVKSQYQLNMLESTDNIADAVAVFEEERSFLYLQGYTNSDNFEPGFVLRFDLKSGYLELASTLLLWNKRLEGVLALKKSSNMLYCAGATGDDDVLYVEAVNITSSTALTSAGTMWIYGHGSRVTSATLNAAGTHLLIATDTTALLSVQIAPAMDNSTLNVIRSGGNAKTVVADPYGFVTIGYASSDGGNGGGSVDIVHPASGMSLILNQQITSKDNVNLLRRTDDDNIIGLSITEQQQGPNTFLVTNVYSFQLDMISPGSEAQLQIGSSQNLPEVKGANAFATFGGFTFTLGRDKQSSTVSIFRSGSRTSNLQGRTLYSNAKRSLLFFPKNAPPMTYINARALCVSLGGKVPTLGGDETELDAIRGLLDQHPVWVGGTFDGTKWVWPDGEPPMKWWAAEFPFAEQDDRCAYVRQGRLFNGHCELLFLPVCAIPLLQVDRSLVYESIPASPWIAVSSQPRIGTFGGVFGLRRVDFYDNFFACTNLPWSLDEDWACGAAWDTAIYGPPTDVLMVSYYKIFVATKTSLYEVNLDLSTQNLVRQYNSFRRNMLYVQKWNLTIVFGETRTDFFVMMASGRRVTMDSMKGSEACDAIEFVDDNYFICITRKEIVRYRYTLDPRTLQFSVDRTRKRTLISNQFTYQLRPVNFELDDSAAPGSNKGNLRLNLFNGLVNQAVAFNASANPQKLCQLVGRNSPMASKTSSAEVSYTSLTVKSPDPTNPIQACDMGLWQNCIRNQLPLKRSTTNLDCSSGTPDNNFAPLPNKTLGWVDKLLADIAVFNGQVSLAFSEFAPKPQNAPTEIFQATANAVTGGVVTVAFTVTNFPCLSRASDFSSYCMASIETCDPMKIEAETCYDTHGFGPVKFGQACDVARYCNATILTAFNAYTVDPRAILDEMRGNARTFAGGLETLLQFNLTGNTVTRVASFDNRVAAFQNLGNSSKVSWDQSTSWLKRDSPMKSFHLMHPTVATKSITATAATLMTADESIFWKRSTTITTRPTAPPIHYTVVMQTDDADEKDNVLYCNQFAVGYVYFAPYVSNPNSVMPPLVVDGVAPKFVGAQSGFWQTGEGIPLWEDGSYMNVNTGRFEVAVNCSNTMQIQLFLNFSDDALFAIPFYVIGKDVARGADAGAPPTIVTYNPLPPDSALPEVVTSTFTGALAGLNGADSISDIQTVFAGLGGVPSIDLFVQPTLGSFVISNTCPASLGTVGWAPGSSATGNKIHIVLSNQANLQAVMDNCVGFYPAPTVVERDILDSYRMAAEISFGADSGTVALMLSAPRRNRGPQIVANSCNVTITVGHDKIATLGQVFRQPIGKYMAITSKITYRGSQPTQGIDVRCNETGYCLVFFDSIASTTNIELTASDGYYYNSTMCGVYAEFVNLRTYKEPPMYTVHAGSSFSYLIPSTLFLSSASYSITGITEGLFPVENTIAFQSPSTIVGALMEVKIYNISVYASNVYGNAIGYIIFNVTNSPPVAVNNYTVSLRALQYFELEIALNSLISDLESDALLFKIQNEGLLPSWLQKSISPGTLSTSPQLLVLKGEAVSSYGINGGKTVSIEISVADSWNSTKVWVFLVFQGEELVRQPSQPSLSYPLHPGSGGFAIPFNLSAFFKITTDWTFYFSASVSSNYAIGSLAITLPGSGSPMALLSGTLDGADALIPRNLTILVMNPFGTATASIMIIGINNPPNLTAAARPPAAFPPIYIGTFNAGHKIAAEVPISNYFSDPDGDAVSFSVGNYQPSDKWLADATTFAPGQKTTAAQTMTIETVVSTLAINKNITLPITCTDGWNTTTLTFLIVVPKVTPPVLVKSLPNFTMTPGETSSTEISINEYFQSIDGDTLSGKVQVVDGGGWITATLTGDKGKESVRLSMAPVTVEDYTGVVLISASNPFGDETASKVFVHVKMTDWQRVESTVTLASAIAGAVLSVIGLYEFIGPIVSFFKGSRIVKQCPLSRRNPVYHFPDDTEEVKVSVRDNKCGAGCVGVFSHWLRNWYTLRPPARIGPPSYVKVLDKAMVLRLDKKYDLKDAPEDCVVQIYGGEAIIIEEFEICFKKVMGFDGPDAEVVNESYHLYPSPDDLVAGKMPEGIEGSPSMTAPLLQAPALNHHHAVEMQEMRNNNHSNQAHSMMNSDNNNFTPRAAPTTVSTPQQIPMQQNLVPSHPPPMNPSASANQQHAAASAAANSGVTEHDMEYDEAL